MDGLCDKVQVFYEEMSMHVARGAMVVFSGMASVQSPCVLGDAWVTQS